MLTIHNPNEDNPPAYFKFFVALANSELPRRKKTGRSPVEYTRAYNWLSTNYIGDTVLYCLIYNTRYILLTNNYIQIHTPVVN